MAVKNLLAFYDTPSGPQIQELAPGDVPNINIRPISGVYYLDKNTSLRAPERNGSITGPAKSWSELKHKIVLSGSSNAALVYVGAGIYNEIVDTLDKIYFRGFLGARFYTLKQSNYSSSSVVVDNIAIDDVQSVIGIGIPNSSKITFKDCYIKNLNINYSHQPQRITLIDCTVDNLASYGEIYLSVYSSVLGSVTINSSNSNVFNNSIATIQGSHKIFTGCIVNNLVANNSRNIEFIGSEVNKYSNLNSSITFDSISYPKTIINNNTSTSQSYEIIRSTSTEGIDVKTEVESNPNNSIALHHQEDSVPLTKIIKDLYEFRNIVNSSSFNNSDQMTITHPSIHVTSKIFIMPHGNVGNFWLSNLQEGSFTVKCAVINNFRFDYWISNG